MEKYAQEIQEILLKMVWLVENGLMTEASPFEAKTDRDQANLAFYYAGVSAMAVAMMHAIKERS